MWHGVKKSIFSFFTTNKKENYGLKILEINLKERILLVVIKILKVIIEILSDGKWNLKILNSSVI